MNIKFYYNYLVIKNIKNNNNMTKLLSYIGSIGKEIGIIIIIFLILYAFRNKIKNNESNLIKTLILFPFIFILHLIMSIEIKLIIDENGNIFENTLSILLIMIFISIMLIMVVLIISSYGNKSKFWHSIKIISFILCVIIPICILPSSVSCKIIAYIVDLSMLLDLIISYDFASELSILKEKKIGQKSLSPEWIGFFGTIITAILSFISAILTHGIN